MRVHLYVQHPAPGTVSRMDVDVSVTGGSCQVLSVDLLERRALLPREPNMD